MILRSATSSAAIVAHIIESCDEAFLIQINRCTSLAEAVAAKVDWNANETRIIRALLRAVSVTQGSLSEFIKLDDEMCCARLVETVSSSGAWALLPRVLSSQIWQSVVEKAATFSIRSCEREKWRMVLECVVTLPNSTAVISSILENNELKNAELFIDLMIACAKNTVDEVCREKIATAALNCLFVSSAVCEELVRGTLEAVRSIGIADNYIAHFANAKLDANDFGQNGLDVALYLAYALPSSCINEFLLTAERLSTQLSYLREYDVEILERNAFLSASVELDLYSLCNSSYAGRELPTKQMRRAIFLLSYIRNKGMFTDDSANTELVYALLFCVAVSCMVGFENAIERRSASAQMLALEEAVKETVMLNENGRRLLLRSAVQFALEHSISLTLLLALRQLGDGLDLSQIGNDLRSRIRDDGLRQRICCAASAVALKEGLSEAADKREYLCMETVGVAYS
ncbi:unnamed protein product [Toxocara canis]|uniref:Uncharacterized protein n=1 Tax=Toxocara canis TaxID=6265 RepID=A0A183VCM4_TOXCA|nr:unnamed protein product [Toxocara canis]